MANRVSGTWNLGVETVTVSFLSRGAAWLSHTGFAVARIGTPVQLLFLGASERARGGVSETLLRQSARDVCELHLGGIPWELLEETFSTYRFPNLRVLDLNGCGLREEHVDLLCCVLRGASRTLRVLDLSYNRRIGHAIDMRRAFTRVSSLHSADLRGVFWDERDTDAALRALLACNPSLHTVDLSDDRMPGKRVVSVLLGRVRVTHNDVVEPVVGPFVAGVLKKSRSTGCLPT